MDTIGIGIWIVLLGLLAWFVSAKWNINLVGKGFALYFFPLIGAIVIIYGIISLLFREVSQAEVAVSTPTPTQYRLLTVIGSPTPTLTKKPTIIPKPPWWEQEPEDCVPWKEITLEDKGNVVCVYGDVEQVLDEENFYIYFSTRHEDLAMVDPKYVYPWVRAGDCVIAVGRVLDTIDGYPILELHDTLNRCE